MEAVLTAGMQNFSIAIDDASQVSAARMGLQRMARDLEFDEVRTGRVAIATTEAASNVLKHGGGGTIVARSLSRGEALGIELLAIDSGRGMESFSHSATDGVSSSGTPGTGLGAMQRLAEEFDVYTRRERGTIVRLGFWNTGAIPGTGGYEVGSVSVPKAGETVNGDAWGMELHSAGATFLVADGLGHGPDAAAASSAAVEALRRNPGEPSIRILDIAHAKLRPTRGAAVAVMRHDAAAGEVGFSGVGNIAACICDGGGRKAMVSHNGIVGHNVQRSEEYRYKWPAGALLIAHSDGIETQWDVGAYPGLAASHPSIIAAMLFREHSRKRDDVVVLVARRRS
jgi:anti-sigma regulatory factor (Ser/Thr protein kinase)